MIPSICALYYFLTAFFSLLHYSFEAEEEEWDDTIEEAAYYHRATRTMRDVTGRIVTKHNPIVNGRRNRQKMEKSFPIGFAS